MSDCTIDICYICGDLLVVSYVTGGSYGGTKVYPNKCFSIVLDISYFRKYDEILVKLSIPWLSTSKTIFYGKYGKEAVDIIIDNIKKIMEQLDISGEIAFKYGGMTNTGDLYAFNIKYKCKQIDKIYGEIVKCLGKWKKNI